jgi:hypothetical protein
MHKHSCCQMIRPRRSLPTLTDPAEVTCTSEDDCSFSLRKDRSSESPTDLEQLGQCPCVVYTPWKLTCSIWKGHLPVYCASPVYVVGRGLCSRDGKTGEVPMSFLAEGKTDLPKYQITSCCTHLKSLTFHIAHIENETV